MKLNFWKKGEPAPYIDEDLNAGSTYNNIDNGTMYESAAALSDAVVGHKIVSVRMDQAPKYKDSFYFIDVLMITLDNGKEVKVVPQSDCCAFTEIREFLLHPESVDHMIMGVKMTETATLWHIYADFGDILQLSVDWSAGNPFYYGYGFHIQVEELEVEK